MNNKFLRQLIKEIQDENTSIAEDAVSSAEFDGYIDTGSLIFNAQLSGSLKGGLPNNKCLVLAGEYAVGKTFFALSMAKSFLDQNQDAFVFWYLAEPALTRKMLLDRLIDPNRVIFAEPDTVQQWKFHLIKLLDTYMATKDTPPMLVVLDSLGALSTTKELKDSEAGKEVDDMTRAKVIKATFRQIDKKLAKAKVPMIVTNHTYSQMDQYKPREIGGGSGPKYAGDIITTITASKDKEGEGAKTIVNGNIIHLHMYKNRFAKQHTKVDVLLSYDTGLDRYYGLLELAEKYEIIKRKSRGPKGILYILPDGREIEKHELTPSVWDSMMDILELAANQEYEYGKGSLENDANNEADSEPAAVE